MWTPHLEQCQDDAGEPRRIGWVLVNESGERYLHPEGGIVTGFTSEEMQRLADELNGSE